ncbi:MAG: type II toxin-antitoxin system RelE/ParE family toxin [Bryobacterales bacterium]|nr:type II toxin-antitoxin system RelE/ParE family toxin [Bryobacterales bacterium]
MKLVVRPAAHADILNQIKHYVDELADTAAERFAAAVQEAIEQIQKQPGIGSPRIIDNPRLFGLRSWPVPGFEDIRLYYLQPQPKLIRVIRVLHGKRDLGAILEREPR